MCGLGEIDGETVHIYPHLIKGWWGSGAVAEASIQTGMIKFRAGIMLSRPLDIAG